MSNNLVVNNNLKVNNNLTSKGVNSDENSKNTL